METKNVFLAKLQQALQLLDEIEDMINVNPERQQNIDWEISDYRHLLEHGYKGEPLSDIAKVEVSNKLSKCLQVRREILNVYELSKVYKENCQRICSKGGRIFFRNSIQSSLKALSGEYKYRVLADSDITDIIDKKVEKKLVEKTTDDSVTEESILSKKRNRSPRGSRFLSKEDLIAKIESGMTNTAIAKECGVHVASVSQLKKLYGLEMQPRGKRITI